MNKPGKTANCHVVGSGYELQEVVRERPEKFRVQVRVQVLFGPNFFRPFSRQLLLKYIAHNCENYFR